MCTVKGVRIKCACKDARCRSRRDFTDRDAQGNVVRATGHGWHYLTRQLGANICEKGRRMFERGEMKWLDPNGRIVEEVVPHAGIVVEWEVQETSASQPGRICDECRDRNHQVA
ncbi:hypothetical protein PT974_03405 [Cladobotryum mycophilum]|uniref:Uncharacterized protein n=1 Tax=Cladobotryum mycophilum TaxID=491253 RepID=A0ABR0STD3_9HYPO